MGFMILARWASSARPLSTLRKGTTPLTPHRYSAVGRPSIRPSMVRSKRMAPRIRSEVKALEVMTRVRMAWTRSNISASSE